MTLTEVERKRALNTGAQAALLDRLHELTFRERARHLETDDYYSRPDVDFMETVECLRVRSRDGFAEITYKPGSTAANTTEGMIAKVETNAHLADAEQAAAANQLLTMLGMVHLAQVDKHRVEYAHIEDGDVTIALDTITNIGVFVEVEVLTADPAGAAAVLDRIEHDLGTTELPVVSLPYRDLVMQADSVVAVPDEQPPGPEPASETGSEPEAPQA